MSHCLQDEAHFEYVWSCARSWTVGDEGQTQALQCLDTDGALAEFDFGSSRTLRFTPEALNLRASTVYEFLVVVKAGVGNASNPYTA